MRTLTRPVIFNLICFYLLSAFVPLVKVSHWQTLALAAVVLSLLNLLVKPLLKIIAFPFNLLTFGLFSGLVNVVLVYLLSLLVPDFQVVGFKTWAPFWSYFLLAFGLSLLNRLGEWFL